MEGIQIAPMCSRRAAVALLTVFVACRAAPASAPRAEREEGLEVDIRSSRAASLFHVVDQLSGWSPYCHPQYERWRPAEDDAEADALLRRHARLRARLGYGAGLEAVLYRSDASASEALDAAVRRGTLASVDAEEEKQVLGALASRLDPYLLADIERARELRDAFTREKEAFERLARGWSRIAETEPSRLTVAVVPTPGEGSGGGGTYGDVIVVEVPANGAYATLTTLGHEIVHALLQPRSADVERAARGCGIDPTTIGESLAYATAPGIFAYGGVTLESFASGEGPSGRFARLAIAVRPAVLRRVLRASSGERGGLADLFAEVCRAARPEVSAGGPRSPEASSLR